MDATLFLPSSPLLDLPTDCSVTTAAYVMALAAAKRAAQDRGEEELIELRFDRLEDAGYGELEALTLALDTSIDLDLACDLPRRGCPHELALEILL
jgi:hypothetical protein